MRQGGSRRRGLVEREPVLLVGENVLDRAIAVGAEPLGARTGGVEPVQPVDPAQPHEPETRAIALLGMRAAFEDAGDEPPRGRAGLVGPPDQAGRGPFGVGAMGPRHVRHLGGEAAPAGEPRV